MATLAVYDTFSAEDVGFLYDPLTKKAILDRLDKQITEVENSFTGAEKVTGDISAIRTSATGNEIIDNASPIFSDAMMKKLFKKGNTGNIFEVMKTNKQIDIQAITTYLRKVAVLYFLVQFRKHVDKHDGTGKYLSPVVLLNFQNLTVDNYNKLKITEEIDSLGNQLAFPDVIEYNDGTTSKSYKVQKFGNKLEVEDTSGTKIDYDTLNQDNIKIANDQSKMADIDTKYKSANKTELPLITRLNINSLLSATPIIDAWLQRLITSDKKIVSKPKVNDILAETMLRSSFHKLQYIFAEGEDEIKPVMMHPLSNFLNVTQGARAVRFSNIIKLNDTDFVRNKLKIADTFKYEDTSSVEHRAVVTYINKAREEVFMLGLDADSSNTIPEISSGKKIKFAGQEYSYVRRTNGSSGTIYKKYDAYKLDLDIQGIHQFIPHGETKVKVSDINRKSSYTERKLIRFIDSTDTNQNRWPESLSFHETYAVQSRAVDALEQLITLDKKTIENARNYNDGKIWNSLGSKISSLYNDVINPVAVSNELDKLDLGQLSSYYEVNKTNDKLYALRSLGPKLNIVDTAGIKLDIVKHLDKVYNYSAQLEQANQRKELVKKIETKFMERAFKEEGMAARMVQHLLDIVALKDDLLDDNVTKMVMTTKEMLAIKKAILEVAVPTFLNVVATTSARRRLTKELKRVDTDIKTKITAGGIDTAMKDKLVKILKENPHPVKLEGFLNKESQSKLTKAIQTGKLEWDSTKNEWKAAGASSSSSSGSGSGGSGTPPALVAPVLKTAVAASDGKSVTLTFNTFMKPFDASTSKPKFKVTINSVESTIEGIITGDKMKLDLPAGKIISKTDTTTVKYTPDPANKITYSDAGNKSPPLASFTKTVDTSKIAVPAPVTPDFFKGAGYTVKANSSGTEIIIDFATNVDSVASGALNDFEIRKGTNTPFKPKAAIKDGNNIKITLDNTNKLIAGQPTTITYTANASRKIVGKIGGKQTKPLTNFSKDIDITAIPFEAPVLLTTEASSDGKEIILTFDKKLDDNSTVDRQEFTVKVNNMEVDIDEIKIDKDIVIELLNTILSKGTTTTVEYKADSSNKIFYKNNGVESEPLGSFGPKDIDTSKIAPAPPAPVTRLAAPEVWKVETDTDGKSIRLVMNTTHNTNGFTNINSQNQNYINDFTVSVNNNPKEITKIATVKSTYNYVIKLFVKEKIKNTDTNITVTYRPNSSRKITWKNPTLNNGIESEPLEKIINEPVTNIIPAPTTPAPNPAANKPVAQVKNVEIINNKNIKITFTEELKSIMQSGKITLKQTGSGLIGGFGATTTEISTKKDIDSDKNLTIKVLNDKIMNNTDRYQLIIEQNSIKDANGKFPAAETIDITTKLKEWYKTVVEKYNKLGVKPRGKQSLTSFQELNFILKDTNPDDWKELKFVKIGTSTDADPNPKITFQTKEWFKDKIVVSKSQQKTLQAQVGGFKKIKERISNSKVKLYLPQSNGTWKENENMSDTNKLIIYTRDKFPDKIQKVIKTFDREEALLPNEPPTQLLNTAVFGVVYESESSDEEFQPMQHRPSFMSYPSKSESKNSLYRY